ncbi:MAG TPA: hypothetical protein VF559_11940 [Caulobacteraceae bacterium]|jgi:hypothetical protein
MSLLDFEGLANNNDIPDGYFSLKWSNFLSLEPSGSDYIGSGYANALHSGDNIAFNNDGAPATFRSPKSDFDFQSGYFAAIADNTRITFVGFDDSVQVAKRTIVIDNEQTFLRFGHAFNSVDKIKIMTSGVQLAMDDLKILFEESAPADAATHHTALVNHVPAELYGNDLYAAAPADWVI